jgi:PRTRC genetic system protein B
MPAMLYAVVFDKFFLFSLKSNKRPTPASKLFVAPVMNLSESINMCWGSVSTKHDFHTIDEEMSFWEDRLWNSTFAHVGSTATKHEIMGIYENLKKTGKKFPKSELIYANMTLGQFIKDKLK